MADPTNPRPLTLTRQDIAQIVGEAGGPGSVGAKRKTLAFEALQQQAMSSTPDDVARALELAAEADATANAAQATAIHAEGLAETAQTTADNALAVANEALNEALKRVSMEAVAAGALVASDMVHVYTVAGVATVEKANATDLTKPCNGYVLAAFAMADVVTVYLGGEVTGLTVNAGATYWLDTTAGLITDTPPAVAGNGDQIVGTAKDATTLNFAPQSMIGV